MQPSEGLFLHARSFSWSRDKVLSSNFECGYLGGDSGSMINRNIGQSADEPGFATKGREMPQHCKAKLDKTSVVVLGRPKDVRYRCLFVEQRSRHHRVNNQ